MREKYTYVRTYDYFIMYKTRSDGQYAMTHVHTYEKMMICMYALVATRPSTKDFGIFITIE